MDMLFTIIVLIVIVGLIWSLIAYYQHQNTGNNAGGTAGQPRNSPPQGARWGGVLVTLAELTTIPNDDKVAYLRQHPELASASVIDIALRTAQTNAASHDFQRQLLYAMAASSIAAYLHSIEYSIKSLEESAKALRSLGNFSTAQYHQEMANAIRDGRLIPP